MPTVYQSSHTGSNIDIAITKTLGCQGLPSVSNTDSGKMLQVVNGLWSAVQPESNLTMASVLDTVYPVGAIYLSVNSTSPATLFGGTWEQIKDKFLLGVGDTYTTVEDTGGAASQSYTPGGTVGNHTLTESEIPSHNHSWTGTSATTSDNNRGHTHNYTDYYATTTGGTAISVAQLAAHNHPTQGWRSPRDPGSGSIKNCVSHGRITTDPASSGNASVITNTGSGNTHNHTGANTSTTRTSQGISQNHTHTVTATGSIGNKGGGGAHNHGFTGTAATIDTMPPYLTVYMWKRTA